MFKTIVESFVKLVEATAGNDPTRRESDPMIVREVRAAPSKFHVAAFVGSDPPPQAAAVVQIVSDVRDDAQLNPFHVQTL